MMKMINLDTLANVVGGGTYELFIAYGEYIESLFAKYGVRGVKNVKKVCTPEEKAMIRELWEKALYSC